jgi:uncharacterized protein DUF4328
VRKCPYCAELIEEAASRCPFCRSDLSIQPPPRQGPPPPPAPPEPRLGEGALRFSHSGDRYLLGFGTDFFGIWDREKPGGPVLRFPRNDRGWEDAWNRYTAWEPKCVEISQRAGNAPVPPMVYAPAYGPPSYAQPYAQAYGPPPPPPPQLSPSAPPLDPAPYGPPQVGSNGAPHGPGPYAPAHAAPAPGPAPSTPAVYGPPMYAPYGYVYAGYRSGRGRALWVMGLIACVMALAAIGIAFRLLEANILRDIAAGRFVSRSTADASDARVALAAFFQLPVMIAAIVMWCVWQFRGQDNLRHLGAADLKFSPGWAVGWWFIPFANFVKPFLAVRELHRASDPHAGAIDWKAARTAPILIAWWAAWLLRAVPAGLSISVTGIGPASVQDLLTRNTFAILEHLATIVAGVLAIMVVREIDRRQTEKQSKIEARVAASAYHG